MHLFFLILSDSSKSSQSVLLTYESVLLAGIRKSEENLLKTLCKVAALTKVAHIVWWRRDNKKKSASAREHWCDVSWDIPYLSRQLYFYRTFISNISFQLHGLNWAARSARWGLQNENVMPTARYSYSRPLDCGATTVTVRQSDPIYYRHIKN